MKYAVVDLGSNTIRLSLYHIHQDKTFELLFSQKKMAGLVNYIDKKILSDEGVQQACSVLKEFQWLLRQFGMETMHVFATASLRNIANTQQVIQAILEQTGIHVDVISGDDEAELGYYGARANYPFQSGLMFDIGGGSTELTLVKDGKIQMEESLEMGSLNLFNRCVSKLWPDKEELQQLNKVAVETLKTSKLPQKQLEYACGIGGTARAVLKIANAYWKRSQDCRVLTVEQLEEIAKLLTDRKKTARKLVLRNCPDRVHTILPGVIVMYNLCKIWCKKEIYISKYGVREGYLCHKLLKDEI